MKAHLQKRIATLDSWERLTSYVPYPKQLEFHAAGRHYRERMLMAGNQQGKTICAGAEVAFHLTGRYPDWWDGFVYDKPPVWWVAGVTSESTRDNPQRILLGRGKLWGTGMVPKDAITSDPALRRGVADAVDHFECRWGGGGDVQAGTAMCAFKSYDQGREKFQGETLGGIWFDEEPDEDIYMEGLTRTNVGLMPVLITFTPLLGMSNVVMRFLTEKPPGTHITRMTIEDAQHYTPEQRQAIIASYPAHERKARVSGIPQLGSGRVFPVDEDELKVPAFAIPNHWVQGAGIDFGWDHPSAAVKMAWDRDSDIIYVIACHRQAQQTPMQFAESVKPWGKAPNGEQWLPWAWPHDGKQSGGKFDAKDQKHLYKIYQGHGLKMMETHATFEDGSNSVEAGVQDMLERMQTGRWKVFDHLANWFEEFNLYHRKDGLIVKERDDLMAASRYGYMMRRKWAVPVREAAKTVARGAVPQRGGWMS